MNIIQLQPGDIFMVTGVRRQNLQKFYRDALRTIVPAGVHILVINDSPEIIRRPEPDATAAYLAARKAEYLDGPPRKEGGDSCPPDSSNANSAPAGKPPASYPGCLLPELNSLAADIMTFAAAAAEAAPDLESYDPHARLHRSLGEVRQAIADILPKEVGHSCPPDPLDRQEADAVALLIRHRTPDGKPIPYDEIRSAIRAASAVTCDDHPLIKELEFIIQHRGYILHGDLDLTDSELDAELVELAIGLPVTIDKLRQQAADVGHITGKPVSNRERLNTVRALHGLA